MRQERVASIIFIGMLILGISTLAAVHSRPEERLELTITSTKDVYLLGETLSFSFELRNNDKNKLVLLDEFGIRTGTLRVVVSENERDFVGFADPGWGFLDTTQKTHMSPNSSKGASGAVLWIRDKDNAPRFRLNEAGIYYFRALYTARIEGEKDAVNLRSKVIKVTVVEPQGDDLDVWNIIKDKGQIAYFLKEGDVPPDLQFDVQKSTRFLEEVQQIIDKHPKSFYSNHLQKSIQMYQINESNRRESLKRLRKVTS